MMRQISDNYDYIFDEDNPLLPLLTCCVNIHTDNKNTVEVQQEISDFIDLWRSTVWGATQRESRATQRGARALQREAGEA